MEETRKPGCAQTNFNNVTCDRKAFGDSVFCKLHAQGLTTRGYELNRGIALDRYMQTRKLDKCEQPGCNRLKTKVYKEQVGQIPFCDIHNLCTMCGKQTTWDYALCWKCDGTQTKPVEKCVEPGCATIVPMSGPYDKLLRCAEHNPCAKCGDKHSWGNFICRKCDPNCKCIETGCQNPKTSRGKGIDGDVCISRYSPPCSVARNTMFVPSVGR